MLRGLANLQSITLIIFENFHPVLLNTNTRLEQTALQSLPPTFITQFSQKTNGKIKRGMRIETASLIFLLINPPQKEVKLASAF